MNCIKTYSILFFQLVLVVLALSGFACARDSSTNYLFNKECPPLSPPPAGLYCKNTRSFIQFGPLCTLGSQFYLNGSVHLTAYDLGCNLIGENPDIPARGSHARGSVSILSWNMLLPLTSSRSVFLRLSNTTGRHLDRGFSSVGRIKMEYVYPLTHTATM